MKIETKEIRNGARIGEVVYICHYLRPDLSKKPLRNLPPTKAVVCSNEGLPQNKTVYYSETHFKPIGENGKTKSQIISPVDNTGYRLMCGNEINVFDNKKECIECWNNELDIVLEKIQKEIDTAQAAWIAQKDETYALKR
jgi:hypothetical protein